VRETILVWKVNAYKVFVSVRTDSLPSSAQPLTIIVPVPSINTLVFLAKINSEPSLSSKSINREWLFVIWTVEAESNIKLYFSG
jgi:hypothetical protein